MDLNQRFPIRDSDRAPAHNADNDGAGCGTLIVAIIGFAAFAGASWRLVGLLWSFGF